MTELTARAPDVRWEHFVVRRLDGTITHWTEQLLQQQLQNWDDLLPPGLPSGTEHNLALSRVLIRYSWYRYELLPTAQLLAYQAVEAMLATIVIGKSFEQLINAARTANFVSDNDAQRLHNSRRIRNLLSHPKSVIVTLPTHSLRTVGWCHQVVATLSKATMSRSPIDRESHP